MNAYLLAAIAILLLLGAMLLWQTAARDGRQQQTRQVLDATLSRRQHGMGRHDAAPQPEERWKGMPRSWRELMLRAGIEPDPRLLLLVASGLVAGPAVAGWLLGPMPALALLMLAWLGLAFFLWRRIDKRRRRVASQLPDFLDLMVRLITIGNSMGAAFLAATDKTLDPLGGILREAMSLHQAGQELDSALRSVSRQHGLHDLFLVAAVISVALRFGGRSDHTLERMAAFMRDRENARNELVALSAEVRLSAWILALLPIGIAAYILMFNPALFLTMWHDPFGFRMLMFALVLQCLGCYMLFRMARSI